MELFDINTRVMYVPDSRPPPNRGLSAWEAGIRHGDLGTVLEHQSWTPWVKFDCYPDHVPVWAGALALAPAPRPAVREGLLKYV